MENEREFILGMLDEMSTEEIFNLFNDYYLLDLEEIARTSIYNADDSTIKQVYSYLRDEY